MGGEKPSDYELIAGLGDLLSGSDGNDSITLSSNAEEGDTFDGLSGLDTLILADNADIISIASTETIFAGGGDDFLTITSDDANFISGGDGFDAVTLTDVCLLYTSPSPRDGLLSRMPSSA